MGGHGVNKCAELLCYYQPTELPTCDYIWEQLGINFWQSAFTENAVVTSISHSPF